MNTLKKFFRLARPFWTGAHGRIQWLMLAILIGFTLCSITISVWIAAWDKRFYDALAAFDGASMPSLIVEYLGYMAMIIGCIVCGDWLQKPQILFLDEATNQLDGESALALMQTLKRALPDTLVIGISHQPEIQALFGRRIGLEDKTGGAQ